MFDRRLAALLCLAALCACGGGGAGESSASPPAPPPPAPSPAVVEATGNLTLANTAHWRSARMAVSANAGRARVAAIGDSTTAGVGSASAFWTHSSALAYPVQLAAHLRGRGLPARSSSFFGDLGALSEFPGTDPRITLGPEWESGVNVPSVGGYPIVNVTTTSPLMFRPQLVADRVDIFDTPLTSGATMDVTISGTSAATIYPPATDPVAPRRTSISFPRNSDPNIVIHARENGGFVGGFYLIGMDAYDSTRADVAVWNMGASGTTTGFWLITGHLGNPLDTLFWLGPDLTFVNLGINDVGLGIDPAVYKANMRLILRRAAEAGDVVVIVPNRLNPAYWPIDLQRSYETALFELSAELGIPIVSIPKIIGEFEQARAAGYYFDDVHLSGAGYGRVASVLGDLLLAN